jgi:hypothetical protein
MICPACSTENDSTEEYCFNCGQRLIESDIEDEIPETKLTITKIKHIEILQLLITIIIMNLIKIIK